MKVKALLNLGSNDYGNYTLADGEEAEVPADIGAVMVARRHAVEIVAKVEPAPVEIIAEPVEKVETIPSAPVADKPKTSKK